VRHLDVDDDGRVRKAYCFSIVLGYSRMRYVEFTLSTDTSTLIQCHLHAFEYFGGYTEEILYDNIKTVILKRALRAGDHQWNPKFEDFFSASWVHAPALQTLLSPDQRKD
jgi:transposase